MSVRVIACAIAMIAGACERPPPSVSPVRAGPQPSAIEPTTGAALAAALIPVGAGSNVVDVEDVGAAIDACAKAGWPEQLPEAMARRLAEGAVGSTVTVIHGGGVMRPTITEIACTPAGDIEGAIASLVLDASVPGDPRDPSAPPALAMLRGTVAPDARLLAPRPERAAALPVHRAALRIHLAERAAEQRRICAESGSEALPTEQVTARVLDLAIDGATATRVGSVDGPHLFAVVSHPLVTFDCSGEQQITAALVDPEGVIAATLDSNNDIALQWLSDLDGDHDQELVVDVTWLEDGMHSVLWLWRDGGARWTDVTLWSADTP